MRLLVAVVERVGDGLHLRVDVERHAPRRGRRRRATGPRSPSPRPASRGRLSKSSSASKHCCGVAIHHDLALGALRSHAGYPTAAGLSTSTTRSGLGRLGHAPGVQQVREQLDPVHQPRPGPREVGRGVHGDHARSERLEPVAGRRGLLARPARRRSRTASTPRRPAARPPPRPSPPCATSRPAGRAGRRRPASSIICGTQWPPMNTGSSHSSAATRGRSAPSTASRTASIRKPASSTSSSPSSGTPGRLGQARDVGQHLAEGRGVEREHLRAATAAAPPRPPRRRRRPRTPRTPPGSRSGRARAPPAWPRRARRAPGRPRCARARRASISGAREALRDHAAREMWDVGRLCRIIALVGDRDDAVAQAEGEQHLGRGRHERRDTHGG